MEMTSNTLTFEPTFNLIKSTKINWLRDIKRLFRRLSYIPSTFSQPMRKEEIEEFMDPSCPISDQVFKTTDSRLDNSDFYT